MIISKKRIISLDFLDKYKNDNIKHKIQELIKSENIPLDLEL